MESAGTIVKTALNPGSIVKFVIGTVIAFAIFDALGLTNWLLYPWTSAKAKFMKPQSP